MVIVPTSITEFAVCIDIAAASIGNGAAGVNRRLSGAAPPAMPVSCRRTLDESVGTGRSIRRIEQRHEASAMSGLQVVGDERSIERAGRWRSTD